MAEKRKRNDGADGAKSKKSKPDRKIPAKRPEPAALPEGLDDTQDFIATPADGEASKEIKKDVKKDAQKDAKKDAKKASSKTKKSPKKDKSSSADATNGDVDATEAQAADAQPKKSKKNKKAAKAAAEGDAEGETVEGGDGETQESGKKAPRHIVFVGNLPFTANAATIRQHFASLKPAAVRCLNKDGQENTCRGFAFVEFANSTNMRTCLDKMHHSLFNDGLSPARKINVELTAGGGGAKDNRKQKIKARNEKLEINRAKRIEKEHSDKKANATGQTAADTNDSVHPSRKALMA